jgi:lipid-A-disaccharide synthase
MKLAAIAGEASGDLLAALLLRGLRSRWPQLHAYGVGGAAMAAQGFVAWQSYEPLAVRGYVEVLKSLPGLLRLRRQWRDRLLSPHERPDVFVGVDAPDFNLRLEAQLKRAGVPTVHFVCPSFWAWRPERAARMAASAQHVLCLFPFEPALLARHGVAATYVGHPLAQVIPMQADRDGARAQLALPPEAPVLAVLPGSRGSEVAHLAPRFLAAAAQLLAQRPRLQVVIPAVPSQRLALQAWVNAAGLTTEQRNRVKLLHGQSHTALAAADAVLVASGTATLEAALYKLPMVIGYHMNPITWAYMRRKQLQPWVGLPNILCNSFVVPELIQDACTPVALAQATAMALDDQAHGQQVSLRFERLHAELLRDTSALASDAMAQVLGQVRATPKEVDHA